MSLLSPFRRSLRNELALLFVVIVALSFAVVFFYVVPQLESRLEVQQLSDLERVTATSSRTLESAMRRGVPADELDEVVRGVADASDAKVTVLGVQKSEPPGARPRFYAISDSSVDRRVVADWILAERAVTGAGGRVVSGLGRRQGVNSAQAARQLSYFGRPNWVALYSRDLEDVAQAVSLVSRRILVAFALALVVAMIGSYLIAGPVTRRVRRLEEAARTVAGGGSVEPLPEDGEDELGRLTRAFNEMQEQLSRVDRARREFIANASHELRTPIFSLGGFVELLLDEDLDPEVRDEFLTAMRGQVERLQKLSVDLLDLSRMDAGALDLRTESVDLGRLVREVAGEFAPAAARHGSPLELAVPEEPVCALCDRTRVTQIVRIFLDNALRHTPEGTPAGVGVGSERGVASVTVTDAGPGVEPGAGEQLFERFYTGDAVSGSGLGLAIARELADRMAGDIRLRAEAGSTAFVLSLPTTDEADQLVEPRPEELVDSGREPVSASRPAPR